MNARPVSPDLVGSVGFLLDNQAIACVVLWASGQFDTAEIAGLLRVREDAVYRTLHAARDGARQLR